MASQLREETKDSILRTFFFLCFLAMFIVSAITGYEYRDYHLRVLVGLTALTWALAFVVPGEEWPWNIPKFLVSVSFMLAIMDVMRIPLTTACM